MNRLPAIDMKLTLPKCVTIDSLKFIASSKNSSESISMHCLGEAEL